jgi:hypothetical protein
VCTAFPARRDKEREAEREGESGREEEETTKREGNKGKKTNWIQKQKTEK